MIARMLHAVSVNVFVGMALLTFVVCQWLLFLVILVWLHEASL